MASVNGSNAFHVQALSRRLLKASDSSNKPHVLPVSNLDLIPESMQTSMFCIYRRPPTGGGDDFNFKAVVAAFEAGLPSFLSHFFPFAGRIATDPSSGLPELLCNNQGAELVVGTARDAALASLDFGSMAASVRRVQQPFAGDMALSVQLVSFACGGFTVAWCTNHVLADGSALSFLVSSWSALARSGETLTLPAGGRPNHDRAALLRPRSPPSYDGDWLDKAFTPADAARQVNVLTAEQSFVERLYRVDAADVARLRAAASRGDGEPRATTRVQAVSAYLWKALAGVVVATGGETRCRMQWWVDGRRRLAGAGAAAPDHLLRNYVGNVVAFVIGEARAEEVRRMALPDVAAMVRETVTSPAYDERLQELVDWVEEHKARRYVNTASLGLGSPTVSVSAFTSFRVDTDFGFGRAVMAMPTTSTTSRLCSGFLQITARPDDADGGAWIASAFLWPRLAMALESDEPRVFKPVTAEYLGLISP